MMTYLHFSSGFATAVPLERVLGREKGDELRIEKLLLLAPLFASISVVVTVIRAIDADVLLLQLSPYITFELASTKK